MLSSCSCSKYCPSFGLSEDFLLCQTFSLPGRSKSSDFICFSFTVWIPRCQQAHFQGLWESTRLHYPFTPQPAQGNWLPEKRRLFVIISLTWKICHRWDCRERAQGLQGLAGILSIPHQHPYPPALLVAALEPLSTAWWWPTESLVPQPQALTLKCWQSGLRITGPSGHHLGGSFSKLNQFLN